MIYLKNGMFSLKSIKNLFSIVFVLNTLYISLKFAPCPHNLVAAAYTAKSEIHTGTKDKPALFPAGMGFFHREDIADADVHQRPVLSSYSTAPLT